MCLLCVVVLCWIDHVWSSKEYVCCACDPNERLGAPSICLCFCMSEVISSFRSIMFVKKYVGGYGGLSESGLCVLCKLCPVCFLVVGKIPSVLL